MGTTSHKDVPSQCHRERCSADAFIKACADFLKRQPKFDVPKYHDIVKTAVTRSSPPMMRTGSTFALRPSHARCTSARALVSARLRSGMEDQRYPRRYMQGPLLQGLRIYHPQGHARAREARDGGRVISSKGRAEMDRIAGNIQQNTNDLLH